MRLDVAGEDLRERGPRLGAGVPDDDDGGREVEHRGEVEGAPGVDDGDDGLAQRRDVPQDVELPRGQADVGDAAVLAGAAAVLPEEHHRRVGPPGDLEDLVAVAAVEDVEALAVADPLGLAEPGPQASAGVTTSSARPSRTQVPRRASPSSTNGPVSRTRPEASVSGSTPSFFTRTWAASAARSATSRVAAVGAGDPSRSPA